MTTHVHRLRIHRISLPMRVGFKHAAAERTRTENLIIELELGDGTVGFGESIPRPYVSGETLDSAADAVRNVLIEPLLAIRPGRFSELLAAVDELPFYAPTRSPSTSDTAEGGCAPSSQSSPIVSARAAIELALLDAYSRHFRRPLDEIAGWLGTSQFATPGSAETVRYSGVLSAGDPSKTLRRLWVQRHLLGLRDFKLKVGRNDDREVLKAVTNKLREAIAAGRASVRVDANAAFSPEQAREWIERMADLPIASLEQPMGREHDEALPGLRAHGGSHAFGVAAKQEARRIAIMADESLVTPDDADRLIAAGAIDLFNIRVSKNGGLIAAMRLAERATAAGLGFQLGCMVGETGLLSAAGWWFLNMVQGVRFAEGSFGRLLLADDITRPSPRFGWGGRVRPISDPQPVRLGLGVEVDRAKLDKYAIVPAIGIPL